MTLNTYKVNQSKNHGGLDAHKLVALLTRFGFGDRPPVRDWQGDIDNYPRLSRTPGERDASSLALMLSTIETQPKQTFLDRLAATEFGPLRARS